MRKYPYYKHEQTSTIQEMLKYCAEQHRTKDAFAYQQKKQDISISYVEFKHAVDALGSLFIKEGYLNNHVAVYGENSYDWILTHFAVTCGKGVIVPIDKELDADSIAELLIDSESRVMVHSDTYADVIEGLQTTLPEITYINMKNIPSLLEKGKELIASGYTDYLDIAIGKDDLASIVYTSGTTGKSKGVMLTHGNFCSCMYGACCNVLLTGPSLLVLPLHHTFGLVASVFAVMFYGQPIYINRSLKRLSADFQSCKPQHLFAVPLIVETLYKNIWATAKKQGKENALRMLIAISDTLLKCKIDLRKVFFRSVISAFGGKLDLIVSGGAPIDPKYIHAFKSFGITVLNGYGITECGPVVCVNRNKFNVVGSVGLPLCCNQVKISEEGEVLVKGGNVMVGYYHNEEENEKVFVDGWFRTGDLGRIDEHGALHITGRIKNLIILSNGENIPAESMESQVYTIPYVKEVVAYGKDDVIVAEVFLDEEVADARERINADIQAINQRLPIVKNIGKVVIRDAEFPKTTTKKIKRNSGG